jgi:SAM-dependent methyltransferase
MGRWSRRLAPLLVRFAGVREGDSVLDVGAGTGALAAAIASHAPTARVTGIDPAEAYVASSQATFGNERIRFEVGDGQHLRFDDATFDRVLSMLVINFIPDPHKALHEMRRVTRRGGTVAAAVWDYSAGMQMLRAFWDEAITLRPGDDKKDERHMSLTGRGQLAALWRGQELQDVVEETLTFEMRFSSFDDYWTPFTQKQGPAGAFVAGLSDTQRDDLQRRLRQRLLGDEPDRPFALSAAAWAVRGTVR